MPVSENQIVKMILLQHLPGMLDQHLLLFTPEFLGFLVHIAAAQGPGVGQGDAQVGMQPSKKPLSQRIGKDFLEQPITAITMAQAIAMGHIKMSFSQSHCQGLPVYDEPHLTGQIVEDPQVMVAGKKMHRYALIAEFGHLTQKTHKSFGHSFFVFKPKIKYIPKQIKGFGLGLDLIEPLYQKLFPLQALRPPGSSQMKIRGEIYFFSWFQGMAN